MSVYVDGSLASWTKNSPFGADTDNRLNGTDNYGNPMDTVRKALRQLQNLLLAPSVNHIEKSTLHHQNRHHWVEAEIQLPGYTQDSSEVTLRMDVRFEKDSLTSIQDISTLAYREPVEDLPPGQLWDIPVDDTGAKCIRLYYKQPPLNNRIDKYAWTLRIKHRLNAELTLPLPDPEDRDNTDSAWVIEHQWTTQ